ncbi:MAG: hypothetical protein NZ761_04805 [Dehalococcoidia bacterium]|nr:hypothetical protein [Dehalococcoidia bacterium]
MTAVRALLRRVVADPVAFSRLLLPERALRGYQAGPVAAAAAVVVARARGDRSGPHAQLWLFSRQSGKDEALAQLLAWLLLRFHRRGGEVVVALPSWRPQGALARERLRAVLAAPRLAALLERLGLTPQASGSSVGLGRATVRYVSAGPSANVRGLTASLLLVANEAQDIAPDRWDSAFAPMAASTGAPALFLGTPWGADSLLARELRYLAALEQADGRRRVWRVPWPVVAAELPAYGDHVAERMAQLGAGHPFVRTEYGLEELAGHGRLFPPERLASVRGDHAAAVAPRAGERYALLVDVAGEDEASGEELRAESARRRDATALTVVRIVVGERPRYETVWRARWVGARQVRQYEELVRVARAWRAERVVVDATGVGAGLAAFLRQALGERVRSVVFTPRVKSELGWAFVGAVESGRYRDYAVGPETPPELAALGEAFLAELASLRAVVAPGPGRLLRWWGEPHDDLAVSAALCTLLDDEDWRPRVARGHAG